MPAVAGGVLGFGVGNQDPDAGCRPGVGLGESGADDVCRDRGPRRTLERKLSPMPQRQARFRRRRGAGERNSTALGFFFSWSLTGDVHGYAMSVMVVWGHDDSPAVDGRDDIRSAGFALAPGHGEPGVVSVARFASNVFSPAKIIGHRRRCAGRGPRQRDRESPSGGHESPTSSDYAKGHRPRQVCSPRGSGNPSYCTSGERVTSENKKTLYFELAT